MYPRSFYLSLPAFGHGLHGFNTEWSCTSTPPIHFRDVVLKHAQELDLYQMADDTHLHSMDSDFNFNNLQFRMCMLYVT
jgi:hypothetical protein